MLNLRITQIINIPYTYVHCLKKYWKQESNSTAGATWVNANMLGPSTSMAQSNYKCSIYIFILLQILMTCQSGQVWGSTQLLLRLSNTTLHWNLTIIIIDPVWLHWSHLRSHKSTYKPTKVAGCRVVSHLTVHSRSTPLWYRAARHVRTPCQAVCCLPNLRGVIFTPLRR